MKALTIMQPWAWCIATGLKLVENRTWRPPVAMVGERFAIHAGLTFDRDGAKFLAEQWRLSIPTDEEYIRGAVVATAVLAGIVDDGLLVQGSFRPGRRDGLAMEQAVRSRWYAGRVGFVLRDVRPVVPAVPCRGAQKLWTVSDDVLAAIEGFTIHPSAAKSHPWTEPAGPIDWQTFNPCQHCEAVGCGFRLDEGVVWTVGNASLICGQEASDLSVELYGVPLDPTSG